MNKKPTLTRITILTRFILLPLYPMETVAKQIILPPAILQLSTSNYLK